MLKINETAPLDLKVKDLDNQEVSLRDYLGQKILLYFYPKDGTPGCTVEACSFRDSNQILTEKGLKVIGVSADSVESHLKFKDKHKLNFELWSDSEHELAVAFGVWAEKKFFAKKFMGIKRTTFLISEAGKIEKVWEDVSVEQHLDEILEYLENPR